MYGRSTTFSGLHAETVGILRGIDAQTRDTFPERPRSGHLGMQQAEGRQSVFVSIMRSLPLAWKPDPNYSWRSQASRPREHPHQRLVTERVVALSAESQSSPVGTARTTHASDSTAANAERTAKMRKNTVSNLQASPCGRVCSPRVEHDSWSGWRQRSHVSHKH